MPTFIYKQNAFGRDAKGKDNPTTLCKLVSGILMESGKIVRAPLHYSAPILFEIGTQSILEADILFKEKTGFNPCVQNIGVSMRD